MVFYEIFHELTNAEGCTEAFFRFMGKQGLVDRREAFEQKSHSFILRIPGKKVATREYTVVIIPFNQPKKKFSNAAFVHEKALISELPLPQQ